MQADPDKYRRSHTPLRRILPYPADILSTGRPRAVHGEMFRTIGFPVHLALLVPHGHLLANQLMEVRFQIKYARVDIQRGHTAMIADIFQPAPEFHGAAELHIG